VQSEGVLVANRRSLRERGGLLPVVHELLERLEAHLVAEQFYSVTCNMRGAADDIGAEMRAAGLGGLQGPTIARVRCRREDDVLVVHEYNLHVAAGTEGIDQDAAHRFHVSAIQHSYSSQ
jgi:ATP phosphoribosyltransferase